MNWVRKSSRFLNSFSLHQTKTFHLLANRRWHWTWFYVNYSPRGKINKRSFFQAVSECWCSVRCVNNKVQNLRCGEHVALTFRGLYKMYIRRDDARLRSFNLQKPKSCFSITTGRVSHFIKKGKWAKGRITEFNSKSNMHFGSGDVELTGNKRQGGMVTSSQTVAALNEIYEQPCRKYDKIACHPLHWQMEPTGWPMSSE